jgi:hypothetical protein
VPAVSIYSLELTRHYVRVRYILYVSFDIGDTSDIPISTETRTSFTVNRYLDDVDHGSPLLGLSP